VCANIVPILNGRDSDGKVICLGPQSTKIHRYLLVVFTAKYAQTFRLLGWEFDNAIYFTLYKLWQVANSFKDTSPYHLAISYDRTKVATNYCDDLKTICLKPTINMDVLYEFEDRDILEMKWQNILILMSRHQYTFCARLL
jgi:hypothetical protein